MKTTKIQLIINHLELHGHITSWEAIQLYRVTRLAAIIYLLNRRGYNIQSSHESRDGVQFAKYSMPRPASAELFSQAVTGDWGPR